MYTTCQPRGVLRRILSVKESQNTQIKRTCYMQIIIARYILNKVAQKHKDLRWRTRDGDKIFSQSPAKHWLTPKQTFKCDQCKRGFEAQRGLTLHRKKCKVVDAWFQCSFSKCPFKAKLKGVLKNHERKFGHDRQNTQCHQSADRQIWQSFLLKGENPVLNTQLAETRAEGEWIKNTWQIL